MRGRGKLIILIAAAVALNAATPASAAPAMRNRKPQSLRLLREKNHKQHLNRRLTVAVEMGRLLDAQKLLAAGADANFRNTNIYRDPLLLIAISKGYPKIVSLLLKHGAQPEAKDIRGTPILVSAAALASPEKKSRNKPATIEAIRVLLREGKADPNVADTARIGDDRSALHLAAKFGNVELMHVLLEHGALVNKRNRFDETPLHFAAGKGQTEAARILLQHGADPNARSRFVGLTALMAAAEAGRYEMVRLLLSRKADVNAKDAFGKTPVALAKLARDKVKGRSNRYYNPFRRFDETVKMLELAAQTTQVARTTNPLTIKQ